jgi:hypothetical protein
LRPAAGLLLGALFEHAGNLFNRGFPVLPCRTMNALGAIGDVPKHHAKTRANLRAHISTKAQRRMLCFSSNAL